MKRQTAVALLIAVSLAGCRAKEPDTGDATPRPEVETEAATSGAWTVPVDVANAGNNPSQTDWYNLAWQTFIALNWPAVAPSTTSNPGQPDTTQSLGASASGALIPTVWMTYRDLGNTMLPNGADPGTWGSVPFEPVPSGCQPIQSGSVAPGFQPMILDMVSKFDLDNPNFIEQDDINEASGNPLIDQSGWYVAFDVHLNQAEYQYIQQNGYYDAANQINAFQPPNTGIQPFPRGDGQGFNNFNPPLPSYAQFGALEVKAAWRVLDPSKDDLSRYYTQVGYFLQPDGVTCEGPATFGLVGFHILRLTPTTPATWYWATFEQVDNTNPPNSSISPSFSKPNTPDGNCPATGVNQPPAQVTGNIPWNDTNTPVDVCRVFAIDSAVQAINQQYQGQGPVQNTVWQYYQLVQTINPSVQGGPSFSFPNNTTATVNTNAMANVTLETYSQGTTSSPDSCMSCHAFGQPLGAPSPLTSTNQIFTFVLQNAGSADPSVKTKAKKTFVLPRTGG
jgi:hypothetical protein